MTYTTRCRLPTATATPTVQPPTLSAHPDDSEHVATMSGVRNLRAMFEQKGDTLPDRGRSPGPGGFGEALSFFVSTRWNFRLG